jgi:hydroxyacylglutathione hydrolase
MSSEQIETFRGVVVDVRQAAEYGEGHVRNSINIGLGGQFASWAGTMVPIGTPLAVIASTKEQVEEAVMRLARVGHDTVTGYMTFDKFTGNVSKTPQVSVEDANRQVDEGIQFVDVRRTGEFDSGHARSAVNIPLDKLPVRFDELDPNETTYVICQGGYRSSIGTSVLENAGFTKLYNVTGGTAAWIASGLPVEVEAQVEEAAV